VTCFEVTHVQNTIVRFMLAIIWVLCKWMWKRQLRAWFANQKNCVSATLEFSITIVSTMSMKSMDSAKCMFILYQICDRRA